MERMLVTVCYTFILCVCKNIFLFNKGWKFFFFIFLMYFVLKKRLKTSIYHYSFLYIISMVVDKFCCNFEMRQKLEVVFGISVV